MKTYLAPPILPYPGIPPRHQENLLASFYKELVLYQKFPARFSPSD